MRESKSHGCGYMLITPAKNEASHIVRLVESVKSQSVKPVIWVFVDDESTDETLKIIGSRQSDIPFLKIISSGEDEREPDIARYGHVVRKGVDFATQYCFRQRVSFAFICILDADMWINENYFQELTQGLIKDSSVGIASGAIFEKVDRNLVLRQGLDKRPYFTASAMMIRKTCYDNIGGFPLASGPEIILATKAKAKNWSIACIPAARGIHKRQSAQKSGRWKGFVKCGEIHYMINYHPVDALLLAAYFTFCKPYSHHGPTISGLAFLSGYARSSFLRKERVPDPDIFLFFQTTWKNSIKNAFGYFVNFARKICV